MKPTIIAIAGPSGSGKTFLSTALSSRLTGEVSVLSLDSYYRDLPHLTYEQRCEINFDHPDSIDEELLAMQLAALSRGDTIEKPAYDFAQHRRAPQAERFAPAPLLIVEGIFALCFPRVRELADLKVYIETPDQQCHDRRLVRDTSERGRTADSVERQYEETVRPMAAEFIWPTREFADLRVSGIHSVDCAADEILRRLPVRAEKPTPSAILATILMLAALATPAWPGEFVNPIADASLNRLPPAMTGHWVGPNQSFAIQVAPDGSFRSPGGAWNFMDDRPGEHALFSACAAVGSRTYCNTGAPGSYELHQVEQRSPQVFELRDLDHDSLERILKLGRLSRRSDGMIAAPGATIRSLLQSGDLKFQTTASLRYWKANSQWAQDEVRSWTDSVALRCDQVVGSEGTLDPLKNGRNSLGPAPAQPIEACREAVQRFPGHPRYTYLQGSLLFEAKRYTEAYPLLLNAARAGYPAAYAPIGLMALKGWGVKPDPKIAMTWFEEGTRLGVPIASLLAGDLYTSGAAGEKNHAKAFAFYLNAADQSVMDAYVPVADAYYFGRGTAVNKDAALEWYSRSSLSRSAAYAAYMAGMIKLNHKRDSTGWQQIATAARAGYRDAQYQLGVGLDQSGLPDRIREANQLFRQAANQGYAPAFSYVGYNYWVGRGGEKNESLGIQWLRKGAQTGDLDGMYWLGMALAAKGPSQAPAEALGWFEKGANAGHAKSQHQAGLSHFAGAGTPVNYARAHAWLTRASSQGFRDSDVALGFLHEDGLGVPRDRARAEACYRLGSQSSTPEVRRLAAEGLQRLSQPRRPAAPTMSAGDWIAPALIVGGGLWLISSFLGSDSSNSTSSTNRRSREDEERRQQRKNEMDLERSECIQRGGSYGEITRACYGQRW